MSISRSQAAALAEGFLDNLGTDKSQLIPRNTITETFLIAGELVEDAQDNLNRSNTNASGNLSRSIHLSDSVEQGSEVSINVMMVDYGQFINKGVRGTKSGQGKYQFKHSTPSRKMVARMLLGIRRARKKTTNVIARKTTSRNEIKNVKLSELSHAWGAATNVVRYGIKPTGFMDKAIVNARKKFRNRLGEALRVDILNSL